MEIGSMIMVWTGFWTASNMYKGVQRCKDVQSTKGSPGASIFRVSWSTMQKRNADSLLLSCVMCFGRLEQSVLGTSVFCLAFHSWNQESSWRFDVHAGCSGRSCVQPGFSLRRAESSSSLGSLWISSNEERWNWLANKKIKQVQKRTRRYNTSKSHPIDTFDNPLPLFEQDLAKWCSVLPIAFYHILNSLPPCLISLWIVDFGNIAICAFVAVFHLRPCQIHQCSHDLIELHLTSHMTDLRRHQLWLENAGQFSTYEFFNAPLEFFKHGSQNEIRPS